jgi:hypothetical protein
LRISPRRGGWCDVLPLRGCFYSDKSEFVEELFILFLDQKETTEKKSAIMIKGENYGKEI